MITRLPRFAETKFASLCAAGGACCHHAEEDENGWDYFVEFAPQPLDVPADTHPPPKSAFVQVKSTRRDELTCRVKLSNALQAARSRQPWFIVLIVADATHRSIKIYAIHVWQELIRETLRRARRAEIRKEALNKRRLTIRFDAADERGDDLVSWMHDTIEAVGPDYEHEKQTIFQTTGYEDGYGIAKVTFDVATIEELVENFLGRGSGIPLTRFTFNPARFGMLSTEPQVDVCEGILQIMPHPAGSCEIRLRGPAASTPIVLSGNVYSPGLPDLPREQIRLRFSSELFDVVWSPNGKLHCSAVMHGDEKKALRSIEEFATLMEWCNNGTVEVQIWSDGKRMCGGTMTYDHSSTDFDWLRAAKIARLLRAIAGSVKETQIQFSLKDLDNTGHSLIAFQELVEAPSLRLEFEPLTETPPAFSALLYYHCVDVCDCTFYALVERSVREDIWIGKRRRVTGGLPQRIEGYVLSNVTENERKMMDGDYRRQLHRQEETGTPLGLSDIRVLLEAVSRNQAGPE